MVVESKEAAPTQSPRLLPSTHDGFQSLLLSIDRRRFRIDRTDQPGSDVTEWAVTRLRRRGLYRTGVRDDSALIVARKDGRGYQVIDVACKEWIQLFSTYD